jgi:hypothetical protein
MVAHPISKNLAAIVLALAAATSASPAVALVSWTQDGADVVANYAGAIPTR